MARHSLAAIGPDRAFGVIFNDDQSGVDGEPGWRAYLGRGGSRAA
jgi:hypothetical protein